MWEDWPASEGQKDSNGKVLHLDLLRFLIAVVIKRGVGEKRSKVAWVLETRNNYERLRAGLYGNIMDVNQIIHRHIARSKVWSWIRWQLPFHHGYEQPRIRSPHISYLNLGLGFTFSGEITKLPTWYNSTFPKRQLVFQKGYSSLEIVV